jgi:2-keto-3-deoxy-L-rhamnonate aldolase RhmA
MLTAALASSGRYQSASTVFAMIESHDAVERAGEIAAVEGVDVILVTGSS